ncbi:MAG TPA: LexA family transcriptional regulator [Polyangiaceae bacterium]|nr:LexA family transcriptional regulator [Polyangiaceae bacterium]
MALRKRQSLVQAVAERIRQVRTAARVTQEQAAQRLDTNPKNYQRMESGRQNLTLQTVQNIADALKVDPFDLLRPPLRVTPETDTDELRAALQKLSKAGHAVYAHGEKPPLGALPVMSLHAAASQFGGALPVQVEAWVALRGSRVSSSNEGRFVALVTGKSMQPKIPDRSLCVFRAPVVGSLEGRIVLAQLRDSVDPDTGGAYAVKRVGGLEMRGDGKMRLRLESINHKFDPIHVDASDRGELGVIAEFERVIPTRPGALKRRSQR